MQRDWPDYSSRTREDDARGLYHERQLKRYRSQSSQGGTLNECPNCASTSGTPLIHQCSICRTTCCSDCANECQMNLNLRSTRGIPIVEGNEESIRQNLPAKFGSNMVLVDTTLVTRLDMEFIRFMDYSCCNVICHAHEHKYCDEHAYRKHFVYEYLDLDYMGWSSMCWSVRREWRERRNLGEPEFIQFRQEQLRQEELRSIRQCDVSHPAPCCNGMSFPARHSKVLEDKSYHRQFEDRHNSDFHKKRRTDIYS